MTILYPDLDKILPLVQKERLFKGRWRFSAENLSPMAFRQQRETIIKPIYSRLLEEIKSTGCLHPLILINNTHFAELPAPLTPFAKSDLTLFLVSLGKPFTSFYQQKEKAGLLNDYFYLHGLGAEFTECLAQLAQDMTGGQNRYSFGYPFCPDLRGNKVVAETLKAGDHGIIVNENCQFEPEFTCCGVIR